MNIQLSRAILVAAMAGAALPALADDELYVFASKDGASFEGATVVLDGNYEKDVPASGIVKFDLDAGSHSIQILDGVTPVHSFRFDSAAGQLVDLGVVVEAGDAKHFVEAYSKIESASAKYGAPEGTVTGKVNLGGAGASGATISVEETGDVYTTDASGRFEITLPRGEYSFAVTHDDSSETQNRDVRFVSNTTRGTNFYLSSGESSLSIANPLASIPDSLVEEVFVTATFDPNAFGESEQFSSSVVNTIDAGQLARFGVGDIAAAVTKAPGITVQDGKYVFIRGLGGRYITTTLNGSNMPSTDPTKRTVPLDLFPTNMVDQLDIKKTFTADMPGESTGGNLVINTRSFPDERAGKISISVGGNTWVTNHDVRVDPTEGSYDDFGWDDGSREEPIAVTALAAALSETENTEYLSDNVRAQVNKAAALLLIDDLEYTTEKANPDFSIGANAGDLVYLGDNELGVFAAANYKNAWSRQDEGISRTYGSNGVEDDYETDKVTNTIDVSGLLSLGLNLGDSHTLNSVSLITRSTESSVSFYDGFNGDALENNTGYSIEWEERQFASQQFSGEHQLGDVFTEWQVTASQAVRLYPDRRDVAFSQEDADGDYILEVPELVRSYEELYDNNLDASFDLSYDLDLGPILSTVQFGHQSIHRERDSDSVSYGFNGNAGLSAGLSDSAPNLLVSDVINVETVGGTADDLDSVFPFQNKTLASDSYEAEMDLVSTYISFDTALSENWQLIFGVRHEAFEQTTETFSLTAVDEFGNELPAEGIIDDPATLPSLSLNWMFNDSMQLRFAASKTVSRPDFKEASNAVFYDSEFSDVRVRGNTELDVSEITNFDLRWEWYFGDEEKVTVAYFYKDIADAIERVALTASGTAGNSRTFQNAESAEISGVEIDFRKDFDLNDSLSQSVFIQSNLALIESESVVENAPVRNLQGQPEYTFNFIVGWDDIERNQEATLLFNTAGESIRDVGVSGGADILEEPRLQVDFNYSMELTETLTVKAKIQNILDEDVEFTQGGEVFRSYRKGTGFQAGVDWKF